MEGEGILLDQDLILRERLLNFCTIVENGPKDFDKMEERILYRYARGRL